MLRHLALRRTGCSRRLAQPATLLLAAAAIYAFISPCGLQADSINSPNITLNVDTNRAAGPGAGNVAVALNTITIAEINLAEYSSGADQRIALAVRPGYQLDPASNVTAQSATVGLNGAAINAAAVLTPSGLANEVLTFNLTSGTNANTQDIIRINGVRLKILNAVGAAGPAQVTMSITTSGAGGAFTDQGIVAANITKGAADRLVFSIQPGTNQAGADLLPAVAILDFGGNIVTADPRVVTLALENNPGAATLLGTTQRETVNGLAAWTAGDDLRITAAGAGYTLRASHSGPPFLSGDTADSAPFDITAGDPGQLVITRQPVDTVAGGDILIDVAVQDEFGNPTTTSGLPVTVDSAVNPGGWPLLVDTSLTKPTVNGVASWTAQDHLRINKETSGYRLAVAGLGAPVLTDAFNILPGAADHLTIAQQPVNVAAGEDIQLAVTALDQFGNVASTGSVPVTLSLETNPGGADLLASGGLTKNTVNGTATWGAADDLRINVAAAGYRILALGAGNAVTSGVFDVAAGAPAALRFVQQPTDTEADQIIAPPVTVQITDAFGNPVAVALPVTLSLDSTCGGALLSGQATSVAGLATFDNLRIDTPCARIALQAASSGLTSAVSDRFDVTAPPQAPTPIAICGFGAAASMMPLLAGLALLRLRVGANSRC